MQCASDQNTRDGKCSLVLRYWCHARGCACPFRRSIYTDSVRPGCLHFSEVQVACRKARFVMMPTNVLLARLFLPGLAVKLGRFVTNVVEPHRDYHDPACNSGFDVTEKVQTHYDSFHHSASHRTLRQILPAFCPPRSRSAPNNRYERRASQDLLSEQHRTMVRGCCQT
jgi:hypothetical protein